MDDYTVVVTSCGRFDLLTQTLRSLLECADGPMTDIIVIEDSTNDGVYEIQTEVDSRIQVILNERQLGQMESIDKAYSLVKTPYVLHCEDDWEFTRTGFVQESATLLEAFPEYSMVGLRPREELNPLVRKAAPQSHAGIGYFKQDPTLHPEYFGYSFNPGLRRFADHQKFAPIAPLGGEGDISYAFKQVGMHMVNLEVPAAMHIGDGRHVDDPKQPLRPKSIAGRIGRSISKRVKRLKRKLA